MPSRCAHEGSVRWRVQGLCYESRARVRNQQRGQLGERAIERVVEGWPQGRWLAIFRKRGKITRAAVLHEFLQLQLMYCCCEIPTSRNSNPGTAAAKKKTRFRVRRSRFADRSAGAAEPRRH